MLYLDSTQNYLDSHQPDSEGFINIPVLISSETEGNLTLTNININFGYKWEWGQFLKLNEDPFCYLEKFTVDIFYTELGGIYINDSVCPNINYLNTIASSSWDRPAIIKHYYSDSDNDGIVDGTSWAENTMQMYWWNETSQNWEPTTDVFGSQNTGVNVTANYVWSNVDHFSNFTTKGSYIPIIETETLLDTLINMNIEPGIKNSLKTKLIKTLNYLNTAQNHFLMGSLDLGNENLSLAINKINDFQNEVEAQKGKSISNEDADRLLTDAEEISFLINNAFV